MKVYNQEHLSDPSVAATIQNVASMQGLRTLKPHVIPYIATLYPELVLGYISEGLGEVHANKKMGSKFEPINSFAVEWFLKTNQIVRPKFTRDCTSTGEGFTEFVVYLDRKYFTPHDVFMLENEQKLYITQEPRKLSMNEWEYRVRLVTNSSTARLNTAFTRKGRATLYVSNYYGELSVRGYFKYHNNLEKHINYISKHRVDVSKSSDYAALEGNAFIGPTLNPGEKISAANKDKFLSLPNREVEAEKHYKQSREGNLLWGETNYDLNGKCTFQDEDGNDIPMGDGLIRQIKQFGSYQSFSNLRLKNFQNLIYDVIEKKKKKVGNKIMLMTNLVGIRYMQDVLDKELKDRNQQAYFYRFDGTKIAAGANFSSYTYLQNEIVFTEHEGLTNYFPDTAYFIAFAMEGEDETSPNIKMYTLAGREMITANLKGVGGMDGRTSGDISTPLDGNSSIRLGHSGIVVQNPYCAAIMQQRIM